MKSAWLVVWLLAACAHRPAQPQPQPRAQPQPVAAIDGGDRDHIAAPRPAQRGPITLSIVGTNDLHGALERLPLLGGFVANLRAARAADGGGVVLVDGGDMFQGTLESNITEGADVVRAYNQLGYAAVAVGNHEFDYGPEGPAATAATKSDDPRGALKARVREAKYPFVVANIMDAATSARLDWPNLVTSTVVEVAGVKVGIIGASTESTPVTTMPANFVGLQMIAPGPAIAAEAQALRARGVQVVVATMHIGAVCKSFEDPDDASSCDQLEELSGVLGALPRGAVDVVVGGHTHAGVAHRLQGVPVIESFANGRGFGRVDLTVEADGRVSAVRIHKPHLMCPLDKDRNPIPVAACVPGDYEGRRVVADPEVQHIVDAAMVRAGERRKEKLGITLTQTVTRAYAVESAVGNWFADLMLAARPDAQVAMTNGGGLRADLPAGELTYGQLFEALPFDNRFALVALTGADLRALVTANLQRGGGIISWGGLTAKARCAAGKLDVQIKVGGRRLDDRARYKLVTSDFLASGGDQALRGLGLADKAVEFTSTIIRDAFGDVLRGWKASPKATIDPARLYSAAAPRLDYEGKRPVECGTNHSSTMIKEPAR